MKLSDLKPNPGNPRKIDDAALARLKRSLDEYGDLSGFVFNETTRRLCGGHQRGKVLPADSEIFIEEKFPTPTRTGTTAIGYVIVDGEKYAYRQVAWDETKEMAANIAANKHGGEWDEPKLADWLLDLDAKNYDLDLTGFTAADIEDICAPYRDMPEADPDSVPAPPKIASTKRGELWLLGNHRLLIDDCTVKENVERLMAGEKADMVFTDPPYGMNLNTDYSQMPRGEKKYSAVVGDDQDFDPAALMEIPAERYCIWGADWFYARMPEGFSPVVWDKQPHHIVAGPQNHFELCWVKPSEKRRIIRKLWTGFTAKEKGEDRVHPTQKPLEVCVDLMERGGQLVVDPFLGSGSTLIACEKTNRKCYGMEIEPLYGDVIIDRWEKFTGQQAKREDGVLWSVVKGQP